MHLAERGNASFAILVIDIDHFKKVNDTYGHSAGDEVLKNVARQIQQSIRSTDQLFRFGGEEFVVLLNNSDCEIAGYIAQRVLGAVRESSVEYHRQRVSVSVSIGLACLKQGDKALDIFNRADAALYAAANDEKDFAEKIAELLDSKRLRRRLGQTGRQRIEQGLSWEHSKKKLYEAYALALGKPNNERQKDCHFEVSVGSSND